MTPPTPDGPRDGRSSLPRRWWLGGLAIAALIVVVLVPLASADPDGLERVAADEGFIGRARDAFYDIVPDYSVPGVGGQASTILAGLLGIGVVFGLMMLVGRLLARRRG
jgi:cobalt/nickel transport system permease protein